MVLLWYIKARFLRKCAVLKDMEVNMRLIHFIPFVAIFAGGCDLNVFFAGNVAVATVPCVLMYLTLNLKRERK